MGMMEFENNGVEREELIERIFQLKFCFCLQRIYFNKDNLN